MKKRNAKLSKSASKRPTWNASSSVSSERRIFALRISGINKGNARIRNARSKMRRISRSRLLKMPSVRQRRPSDKKRMRRKSWLSSRKERQLLHKQRQMEKLILLQMLVSNKKHHLARPRPSKIIRSRKERRKKDRRVRGRVSLLKRHLSMQEHQKMANKMRRVKMEARAKRRTVSLRRLRKNSKKIPLAPVLRRSTK